MSKSKLSEGAGSVPYSSFYLLSNIEMQHMVVHSIIIVIIIIIIIIIYSTLR